MVIESKQVTFWLNRDPIGSGENNLYAYAANDPIDLIDPLGLKPVAIEVSTLIRPNDYEAGVKTIQSVVVDDQTGQIMSSFNNVGFTNVAGIPVQGVGSFTTTTEVTSSGVVVTLNGNAHSATLPSALDIDYNLKVNLNSSPCDKSQGTGQLTGTHDKYPSYVVDLTTPGGSQVPYTEIPLWRSRFSKQGSYFSDRDWLRSLSPSSQRGYFPHEVIYSSPIVAAMKSLNAGN